MLLQAFWSQFAAGPPFGYLHEEGEEKFPHMSPANANRRPSRLKRVSLALLVALGLVLLGSYLRTLYHLVASLFQ